MSDGSVAYVALLGGIAVGGWVFSYGRAWVAGERFLAEMTELADDIEDAVFAGVLPDIESVQYAWVKAGAVATHVGLVSFSAVIAAEMTMPRDQDMTPPSYWDLKPSERKLMHEFDDRFVQSVAQYIVNGSRLWWVFPLLNLIPDGWRNRRPHRPEPVTWAEHFNMTLNKSKVHTPEGPDLSPQLYALS